MAAAASAKSNVMKSIIPSVKKYLLPSGRAGDSAVSTMSRSLSTAAAKYRPEDDSAIQEDIQSRQASEIRRGSWPDIFEGDALRSGSRKSWDAIEDEKALHLRVDMPGLGKEDVKVYAEENALVIKGESLCEAELDGSGRKYSSRIEVPAKVYKLDQIKAPMKNGVLKVTVPKCTEEEIKNVINVKIE